MPSDVVKSCFVVYFFVFSWRLQSVEWLFMTCCAFILICLFEGYLYAHLINCWLSFAHIVHLCQLRGEHHRFCQRDVDTGLLSQQNPGHDRGVQDCPPVETHSETSHPLYILSRQHRYPKGKGAR